MGNLHRAALPAMGLGLALGSSLVAGCGGGGGSSSTTPATVGSVHPGAVHILLADAPVTGLQAVNVTFTKLEALYDGERDSQNRHDETVAAGGTAHDQKAHHGGHIQQTGDPTPSTSTPPPQDGGTTPSAGTGQTTGEHDDGDNNLEQDDNDQWVTLSSDSHTVNLLDYANKPASALFNLVNVNVPSGQYKRFRFTIGAVQLVFQDGHTAVPTLTSNTVEVKAACWVNPSGNESLVLDFDVADSLQTDGAGNYTFDPKLRLRPQKAAGTVSGTVQFQSANPVGSFEAHVDLLDASGKVVAGTEVEVEPGSPQTSAQANFVIHAVPPGSFNLKVTGDGAMQAGTSTPVPVQVGAGQAVQAGNVTLTQ